MHPSFRSIGFYLLASILFMMVMMTGFTLFYYWVEPELSLLDAFYFTVVTTRTIGFGDIYPTTTAGKLGTILNALIPATIFMGISLVILEHLFLNLEHAWRRWRLKRHYNHTIIIADDELLPAILAECRMDKRKFLVVGPKPYGEISDKLAEMVHQSEYVTGDPAEDHTLKNAGLTSAQSIVIATSSDTTNLFVLVSSKAINPNVKTIVRINQEETGAKFRAVGADYLLPAAGILGRMLSQAAVNPISHGFLVRLHTHTEDPFLAEVPVHQQQAGQALLKHFPRAVAVYRDDNYLYDLDEEVLRPGDIVLIVSLKFRPDQLKSANQQAP